jgi:hypothetical protein
VSPVSANFGFLNEYGEGLVVLGAQAECYFTGTLLPRSLLRQLAERLLQETAAVSGPSPQPRRDQVDLLRRLIDRGVTLERFTSSFHGVRRAGNAVHQNAGSTGSAAPAQSGPGTGRLVSPELRQDRAFKAGPRSPHPPVDASAALERSWPTCAPRWPRLRGPRPRPACGRGSLRSTHVCRGKGPHSGSRAAGSRSPVDGRGSARSRDGRAPSALQAQAARHRQPRSKR